jgi:hypothetical protein
MSVCLSDRPSARIEQLGSHWTDFYEIWYSNFFKSVERSQASLKSDNNNGYYRWRRICIFHHILLSSSQNEKFFRHIFREKTCILCSVTFFFRKSCHLWDNVEKYCRVGQATDDNMVHARACWITKAIDTHSEYVILIAFSTATVARTRLSGRFIRTSPVLFLLCLGT